MTLARKSLPAPQDLEALVQENVALRHELRRRKRRVLMRRVRRGSAVVLPVARAISRKRGKNDGDSRPARSASAGGHPGAVHAAVAALVVGRIVADTRSRPPSVPSSPARAS